MDVPTYCIYWRLEGKKRQLPPIGKSVSVSFRVRVVRACVRAKLCGCVGEVLLNAGGSNGKISDSGDSGDSGGGCISALLGDSAVGFKAFPLI